jgi:uncharacterized coiled-coil DUF342 family protein
MEIKELQSELVATKLKVKALEQQLENRDNHIKNLEKTIDGLREELRSKLC